jgi:hypothetical protein
MGHEKDQSCDQILIELRQLRNEILQTPGAFFPDVPKA